MADRKLIVEIIGDSGSLERSFKQSAAAGGNLERSLGRTTRGAIAATVSIRGLSRALAFGSAQFLGGAGIAFLGKSIIEQSSRIQEETEKTGIVFGRNARDVQAWAKTLSEAFGLSQGAALQASGTFGNMLRPLGFGTAAAAQMSKRLVELAADMASFNNVKPDVVLQALQSGLAGQIRPLRQYGVFLSQARIQSEALSDGIAKNAAHLTQAQKVEAAYNIILKDTKLQQGDVARNTQSLSVAFSKLQAGVQNLESGLGDALLPSLTSYVNKAAEWLNQTENQQRVQHDFERAIHDVSTAVGEAKQLIGDIDHVTGSFKHTLELLVGLKVASVIAGWGDKLALYNREAKTAEERSLLLQGTLKKLAAIGVITVGIEVLLNKDSIDKKVTGFLRGHDLGFLTGTKIELPANISIAQLDQTIDKLKKFSGAGDLQVQALEKIRDRMLKGIGAANQWGESVALAVAKAAHGLGLADAATAQVAATPASSAPGTSLTASQRNTFFDNQIARILLRGGLGTIGQQISALQTADSKIAARLKITKDVTRRLNLEDELLQNEAQIRGLQGEQVADKLQAKQDARDKAVAALQAKQDARAKALANLTAKQFRQLGLTATGDQPTPLAANLRKQLASLTTRVSGTSLDTPKLKSEFARIGKVLTEGLVPKDVRSKIAEMFADIRSQFEQGLKQQNGDLTKFSKINGDAFVAAVGGNLTPEQKRRLRSAISQIGAGGTVPGSRTPAFASTGAVPIIVHNQIDLDGRTVARNTTKHQQTLDKQRSRARRGPYAGRH